MYTTTSCINEDTADIHFMNENDGPDSAAPSCSEVMFIFFNAIFSL